MPNLCDPNSIAQASRCYYMDESSQRAAVLYLLCRIYQNGGGSCSAQAGAGSPVGSATPAFIGQLYHDTVADAYWRSTGLTAADWTAIGGGSSTDIILNGSYFDALMVVSADPTCPITSFSFPDMTTSGGGFSFSAFPNVIGLSAPLLSSISGPIDCSANTSLTAFSLPSLVTANENITFSGCTVLQTVSLPLWVPAGNAQLIDFTGCALDAASVELILSRCALAGVVNDIINLTGGTNAGLASLSAQGQLDYAALVTAGNTMSINP